MTSISYSFLPSLQDRCKKQDRKIVRGRNYGQLQRSNVSWTFEFTVVVRVYSRPVHVQARQNPAMEKGSGQEVPLGGVEWSDRQLIAAGRKPVFFNGATPGRSTILLGITLYPRIHGQHKLCSMSQEKRLEFKKWDGQRNKGQV